MKRQFKSETAHYATVTSPAETFSFEWDADTGAPSRLDWLHGGVAWYLYKTPGSVTKQKGHYWEVDLHITTDGYQETAYSLKGKLTIDATRPDGATFAAIYEGTGTAWFVADGTLTDVS
jgi:hypothetical protein